MDRRQWIVATVFGPLLVAPLLAQAARYEVSGSGHIEIQLPGYHASSTFEYVEEFDQLDDVSRAEVDFDSVTYVVNGVTYVGGGWGRLDDEGFLEYLSVDGPFEWEGRTGDGLVFDANGVRCVYIGDDRDQDPLCRDALRDADWDSDVWENEPEIRFSKPVIAGCKSVTATLTLPAPAEWGGETFVLSDTLAATSLPPSVTVAEGETSSTFRVTTSPVASPQVGWVIAEGTDSYSYASAHLTVRPIGVRSIALSPSSTVGGLSAEGAINLECAAEPGPITVSVTSSKPGVASPVATSIVVPQGMKSAAFTIATTPVGSKQVVTIAASANGVEKTKSLSVISAAAVSPTSLAFGNQAVGVPTGTLNAVLSNKGAVGYSIMSLTVTGTQPKMFVPTHNCPAILPAGASCTIGVTFTPFSVGKKAAQLNIATSAKEVPLVVKMTGTGG